MLLLVAAAVTFHAPACAGLLDFLCSESEKVAASVPEEWLGTTSVATALNIFKGPDAPPGKSELAIFVKTRTCRLSQDPEYETWVMPNATGASPWVPLAGAVGSLKDGNMMWVVGKSPPKGTDFLSHVLSTRPERRIVRLYFAEPRRREIESGRVGGLQVESQQSSWVRVRKGELIQLPGGGSAPVSEDLAGLELSLTIRNTLKDIGAKSYPDAFYLSSKGDELLYGPLECSMCKEIAAGETRSVRLTPVMKPLAEYTRHPPHFLVNVRTGLRLPLSPK